MELRSKSIDEMILEIEISIKEKTTLASGF
jgi:hypothetical protein